MKKLLVIFASVLLGIGNAQAQDTELGIFNHFSLGLGVGTTGITLEAAAPVTPYVAVRAGVDIFPNFTVKPNVSLKLSDAARQAYYNEFQSYPDDNITIEGKTALGSGHFLIDAYPSKSSSFHITVGAYFSSNRIIDITTSDENALFLHNISYLNHFVLGPNDQIGAQMGDYLLKPDIDGVVRGRIETNGFRPYVGFGFGRPVPTKHRFACNFDMGVQFWGKPKVYAFDDEQLDWVKLEDDGSGSDGGFMKTVSKISVFPVINVRFVGRIL